MIAVDLEKQIKTYKGAQLLQIKKTFLSGTITRIIGPSGAGKTTFLQMIAGLITPDNGSILVDKSIWYSKASKINIPPQQRKVGFVFQHYALFPNMTVKQHLSYATDDETWKSGLLNFGGLQDFTTHKPDALSGGQQQRLGIIRALAGKPKIILMDEPFSALDFKMKAGLIADLKTLLEDLGSTTLIVSHNPQELDGICNDELDLS